jgi:hypothetical protein
MFGIVEDQHEVGGKRGHHVEHAAARMPRHAVRAVADDYVERSSADHLGPVIGSRLAPVDAFRPQRRHGDFVIDLIADALCPFGVALQRQHVADQTVAAQR